jgi:hypothetical protein
MADIDLFRDAVAHEQNSGAFKYWASSPDVYGGSGYSSTNPAPYSDLAKWYSFSQAVLAGQNPTAPPMNTEHGKFLIDSALMAAPEGSVTPPPPTTGTIGNYKGFVCTATDVNALAQARSEMGGTYVRADYWRVDDNFVNAAKSNSINVLLVACYAMGLSSKGDHYPPDPLNISAWCDKTVTKLMKYNLDVTECWNEPWLWEFWQSGQDPVGYYNLLAQFSQKVWSARPNCVIVVPFDYYMQGGTKNGQIWQDQLIAADTKGILKDPRIRPSTHNYCQSRSPQDTTAAEGWRFTRYHLAYDALKAHGHPDPQVWVTEFGWRAGSGTGGIDVDLATQSKYITDGIKMMQSSGKVERAFVFEYKPGDTYNYNIVGKPAAAAIKALT